MFLLEKTIALLIAPLGLALLLGVAGWLAVALRWRRTGLMWVGLALVWLYAWSTPWASEALQATLERQHPAVAVSALESAPVMVVLGGGVFAPAPPLRPWPDLGRAADRVWHAARLYHAGRAPRVVLSGGVDRRIGGLSEAEAMRVFLLDLGVPAAAIQVETGSVNTRENAAQVARLLDGWAVKRVLLVTSASHLPRATRLFERQGLEVIPVATDVEAVDSAWDVRKLLPDAAALNRSGEAFKEWVGLWSGR